MFMCVVAGCNSEGKSGLIHDGGALDAGSNAPFLANAKSDGPTVSVANPRTCPEGSRLVEAGTYTIGTRADELGAEASLQPTQYKVSSALCVEESEVTVSSYEKCVSVGACEVPRRGTYCNYGKSARSLDPIDCVTREQARAYCRYVGKRLLREEEWEAAARGLGGVSSPLAGGGLKLDLEARKYCLNRGPAEGTCPANATPPEGGNGLRGLSGNVKEWTSSTICGADSCPGVGVVRGGDSSTLFYTSVAYAARHATDASNGDAGAGIRCVSEYKLTEPGNQ